MDVNDNDESTIDTKARGTTARLTPGAIPEAPASVATAPVDIMSGYAKYEAVVTVDASLYTTPVAQIRLSNDPMRVYPLILAETFVGRHSEARNIHPDIHVNDPGVSHRHCAILRSDDGTIALLDVQSTNGTWLNDVEVAAGERMPLTEGDQITIGYWTRVAIRARHAGF